ncbi:MAG: type IV pilin protein [Oceanospirillales bacterium]|uniref:Type IV pilus assembly protein PilE n=1 Tax=Marinobacterium halophilum TaxID=267374 RepID=A0A2P8F2B4_9GAMM|nr:type IV pilin protein [Marinobacterium halophilum]MBR9830280.1 type IV pilin protein [Oceanospirillales bacterium]PSL15853.1 type IV pilus assembly protein PilE [Marinobacterium halophilum]
MTVSNTRSGGFTLIELMIVVLIIGILSAIAYPSYVNQVQRGNRAEGRAAIATAAQQLERCYTRYNSYNDANCNTINGDTETGLYSIAINAAADSYTITATQQFGDATCGNLTLQHNGVKGSNDNDECW